MAFTREQLFAQVWGESFVGETRTVDMHIRTLRQKLGEYCRCIETLRGVVRLFHEIVCNLTENAIKYNVPGGSVSVTVTQSGVLTVADTGIGIPEEHQSRVFERFYRGDKSHSRAIGGTGLFHRRACRRLPQRGHRPEKKPRPGNHCHCDLP